MLTIELNEHFMSPVSFYYKHWNYLQYYYHSYLYFHYIQYANIVYCPNLPFTWSYVSSVGLVPFFSTSVSFSSFLQQQQLALILPLFSFFWATCCKKILNIAYCWNVRANWWNVTILPEFWGLYKILPFLNSFISDLTRQSGFYFQINWFCEFSGSHQQLSKLTPEQTDL